MMKSFAAALAVAGLATGALAQDVITTFDNGTEDWSVSGRDDISVTGGNPGANMDVFLFDVFGADIRNTDNAAFHGDYTQRGAQRLTCDILIDSIDFFGTPVSRELVVELRTNQTSSTGAPYVSVWYSLGILTADNPGWHTYSVDIMDPNATELPDGWGGTGAEDPNTFEPLLDPAFTFADVLSQVDSIHFTTFVPGFFFGFTNFDMSVDNVGIIDLPDITCPVDWNGDGLVNSDDFFAFTNDFIANADADYNGDGVTNSDDFFGFIQDFLAPPAGC